MPLNTRSVYRSDLRHPIEALTTMHLVCRNARSVPWVGEETLAPIGERDSTSHDIGPRTSKPSSPSEEPDNRIFRGYCGAEGFGKAQPISYQSQGLCRGGRSARVRMKGIQTAKIYCRGRPCPRQTKITEGEGATSLETVPSRIPKEIPNPMGHP